MGKIYFLANGSVVQLRVERRERAEGVEASPLYRNILREPIHSIKRITAFALDWPAHDASKGLTEPPLLPVSSPENGMLHKNKHTYL